jgi:hypothetical protein
MPSPTPGQTYWNARLQRYAVVFEVWGAMVRAVLLSPKHDRPPRAQTWPKGIPGEWVIYYEPRG